jgi:putative FmdB family regulatory protein
MPLYEYQCTDCGDVIEEFRSIENRHKRMYCKVCEGRMELYFTVPKALRTDTSFQARFHGDGCKDNHTRQKLAENARRMGISVSGKKYDGRLARFQGDPEACYGSVSEARSLLRKRNLASEDLGVMPPPDETTGKPYRVSDECVERRVKAEINNLHGGSVTPGVRQRIAEEVREKITPPESSLL